MQYVRGDEVIALLQEILRIRSENPPGNERDVAYHLGERLRRSGFDVSYFEPEPLRTSVVAILKGTGGGRSLILNGHIDTGPVGEGWTRDPLGGQVEDGKIYGRGAGDMKSGIAAMVGAAEAVIASGMRRRGDLILMLVADESSGGHKGTGYVVRQVKLKADMAVVCEPSGTHIAIAHRGVVWVEVEVRGKSGQAARPWSGVNAISLMGRVITALDATLPGHFAKRTHEILPSPTHSFGTIAGGIKPNVIAEACRVVIDRRTLPGESVDDVVDEIQRIAEEAIAGTGARVQSRPVMVVEPSEVPADSEPVNRCREALRAVTGMEAKLAGAGGFTDAHWLNNNLGIPTVVFGPWYLHLTGGSVSDIPDEFNYVEDVVTGTRVYAHLIADVIG
ncbi:M20 family metallopeptidase [Geochorda subterranea]|uniref:M20 family metallopeptidase n=1 Tax=Geochorda subterranea TaxID=3109564 RepID=A0ABZ1BQP4_9FIRM|nr:M20 family metallopeptidase [Limnochorda sp. LNt]WRP15137.1 M20 family metallopeptidase [Limnochorda sp. LNt]